MNPVPEESNVETTTPETDAISVFEESTNEEESIPVIDGINENIFSPFIDIDKGNASNQLRYLYLQLTLYAYLIIFYLQRKIVASVFGSRSIYLFRQNGFASQIQKFILANQN